MRTITRISAAALAVAVVAAGAVLAEEIAGGLLTIRKARAAMADRDYAAASRSLTELIRDVRSGERVEEAYVLLLRARIGLDDVEGALEAGRGFLSAFPGSPWEGKVRGLMADAYVQARGFEDAARIYRERTDFLSGDAHLKKVAGYYLDLARKAYEGEDQPDEFGRPHLVKDFRRALSYYLKAREIHLSADQEPWVSHRIATCRAEVGDRSGAVAEWRSLLEKWPESKLAAEATYRVGETLAKLGDRPGARKALRRVIESHTDTPWAPLARIRLGETFDPLDTRDEAALDRGLHEWREYLRLYPSHEEAPETAYRVGLAQFRFGRYDGAIEDLRSYLETFAEAENAPEAQNLLGVSFFRKEEFDRAIAEWKVFLGRWPNHELWTKVKGAIAAAAFEKGRHPLDLAEKAPEKERAGLLERAERGLRAFLAEYPMNDRTSRAQYLLGEIDDRRKDFAGAVTEWRIVASKYAETSEAAAALFRVATTYEKNLTDLTKAIETYEDLVGRYPGSREAGTARRLLDQFRKKLLEVVTERVQRTDETPVIQVRTRNIETLKIRAWPVSLEDRFLRHLTLAEIEKVAVEILPPVLEKSVLTAEYEKYRLFTRDLPLELGDDGPGAYIVSVQDEDLTATTLVVISDLTIVTKSAPGQQLVFATNERTGERFPGVRVLAEVGGKLVTGRTNDEGVWIREGKGGGETRFFAESAGHVAFTDLPGAGGTSFGYVTKAYIYTDRPLYRPGQQVMVKGIYRRASGGAYLPSAGEPLDLEVRDSRDTVVHREKVLTNEYGTFATEVWLPDTAALGTYKILATNKSRQTFRGAFDVEEFRKPEFTIRATSDRRAYLPGEEVKLDVALRYFFGGPVPRTTVRYTVFRGPFAFDPAEHDEFAWFTRDPERERERERALAAGLSPVTEGEIRTDADGNAVLTVKTEDTGRDVRYVVQFEALDLNREWVRESAAVIVTRPALFAIAKTEKKVYRPGEEVAVDLTTVDALHFPVGAEGKLVVARRRFVENREAESVVSEKTAKTGEDGRARVTVRVDRPGEYRVRFVTRDRAGNPVTGSAVVTIAGETEDLDRHAKVVASRQIYREGDVAEILVNSPVAPAWALLTFEGEKVLDHEVVRLTERSTTLRLLMKPEYAPNVFVRVAIPKDHELHEAGDEVYVFKYLQVTVAPDRPEAKPGEEVSWSILTTDQRDQPISAEVSLAVIDRSILALRPDATPQLKPFFYDQRRTHGVRTGSSYSFRYAGDTRPTDKALLWEELRRQGPVAFNRTMKYLQTGKQYLARGDLENAAIEFRKALQVSPMNYEARELLNRTTSQLELRRRSEELARLADKLKDLKEEQAESGSAWGAAGKKAGRPSPEPAQSPAPPATRADRRGGGGGGRDKDAEDAVADSPAELAKAELHDASRRKNRNGGDFQGAITKSGTVAAVFSEETLVPARLRQNFADTAKWEPRVVTGADGRARVTFDLPDNLTTWRAVARGVTTGTLVGEGRADLTARKDLLVRIDTPRFLTGKDRATISATIHNNLGEEVGFRLGLGVENIATDREKVTGTLAPRAIRPYDFTLDATGAGLAEVTATVETSVESDAAVTGIPVVPHGLTTMIGRSGEVTEEAFESLDLPDGIVPGTRKFLLMLSPGIDASVLESLVYLDSFPYGCLEQTVNRFLPAAAARRALDAVGSPNAKLEKALDRAVRRGLLALYSFQNDDGSFGWFGGDVVRRGADRRPVAGKGDPLMTAYAILGIERARQSGFEISEPHRQRALAAGRRLAKEAGRNPDKAFLLHALALAGAADLEDLNQVYRYRDGLDAFSLATLALAMRETGRTYNSVALVDLLKPGAVREDGLVHWEGEDRHGAANAVETTAWAVRALLAVEPESDLLPAAVRWLLLQKQGPRWTSTRDTGAAVMALSDWLVARGVEKSDYTVSIWVNDGTVPYQKIRVAGGEIAGDNERTVILDGARLRTGENRIRISKEGPGRLFYTLFVRYVTEAEDIAPDGNLIRLDRRYTEYVSPVAAKEGNREIEPGFTIVRPDARPKEDRSVTIERAGSGDKFRVRISLDAREPLSYVIVTDPLPAGVEVVEGQASGPFDWEERRDTKQVFFVSDVPAGRTELSYLVQAVHPGAYHALPAMAWPMYEPAIHGRSGENRLSVVPESGVVGRPATPEGVTPDEIYQLARRAFEAERFEEARKGLTALLADFRLLDEYQTECQAMLMRANFALGDHRRAVEAYEKLVELNPRRGPKDREERRKLAVAYQEIGEFERAVVLFKGVTDEHFTLESGVAATYREIGQDLRAHDFTVERVRSYPDSNAVVEETWRNALRLLEMKRPEGVDAPELPGAIDAGLMLPEALAAFRSFLSHHPGSRLADEADRMIVSVLNRMELFDDAVAEAERFIGRYGDSVHLDDVYYYLTESFYGRGDYEKVFETGKVILERKFRTDAGSRKLDWSPFIPFVRYTFAKVHHHRGELARAVELYRQVDDRFEDARDTLAFLTEKELSIPETLVRGVGEQVDLPVRRKNLTEVEIRLYPVDLMLLLAVKKDLRNVNDVDLTGIAPRYRIRKELAEGEDYTWHEDTFRLSTDRKSGGGSGTDEPPLAKGAYLVVARSGDLAASSLVVVSDIELSLKVSGEKVRVYAVDRKTGQPVVEAFVKVSDGREIKAQGFTDARGVFEGRNVSGPVMVVAEKDGHYALVRR